MSEQSAVQQLINRIEALEADNRRLTSDGANLRLDLERARAVANYWRERTNAAELRAQHLSNTLKAAV
ncbi:MAG: hypothetical protein AB7E70_20245 [Hyphomicrobiaceae bacterium]